MNKVEGEDTLSVTNITLQFKDKIKLIILLQTSEGWGRWGENTSWLSHNSDETLKVFVAELSKLSSIFPK